MDEVALGLGFLQIVRFSHHFHILISFVEKPTLYEHSN